MKLESLVLKAKESNYDFIALTDETLYGSFELFKLAKREGIKAVLGLKITVVEPEKEHFLVYVKNDLGYANLLKLNLLKETNHQFSLEDLVKHQEGLIFVSGGYFSIIDQTIIYGNEEEAINYINKYMSMFNDFYVGLGTNHELQIKTLKRYLLQFQNEHNFKIVPIHQTNYLKKEDKDTFEVLLKIKGSGDELLDLDLSFNETSESYDLDEFINSINFNLVFPVFEMPEYLENENDEQFLINLANRGLKRRLQLNKLKDDGTYHKRLNYELDIIISKGFTNYFLIVYDFILYAKTNNVLVGPGRGSASGSLVSYCLGITEVDPIKHNLLFERFLNVERVKMPDIDIDFPDSKRSEIIDYVKNKYGTNHIASITTFDTFQTKSSIRDVSRALDIPLNRVTAIINAVERRKVDKSDEVVSNILKHANKLNGLIRHTGTHPAGLVLAKQNFAETIPLKLGAFDFYQIGFDAKVVESLGLNKIDFLGIRNLSIISEVLSDLKADNISININNILLDDKKTYELLTSGNTNGIFQLESRGMQKVLQKLKPSIFEDLVATLALFRPGPMANIDVYIERKNGRKFNYLDKTLEPILKSTYGIIIYQEQIMQIANQFAGYSLLEADSLRVGMGKKDLNILKSERVKFISGAMKLGHSEELALEIFELILKFADYGINRSHSVAYSLVAYQMAYLKTNYFDYFMMALLNAASGSIKETLEYLKEVSNNNIKIHIPNINKSTDNYLIKSGHLLMPLSIVKGINKESATLIIKERDNGLFESFEDFKERMKDSLSNNQLIKLINAGAFDAFGQTRQTLNINLNDSGGFARKFIKDYVLREVEEYDFNDLAKNELDALGFNVLYDFKSYVKNLNLDGFLTSEINHSKRVFNIIGLITKITSHITKNNQKMLFITLSDHIKEIDITVFSDRVDMLNDIKVGSKVLINVNYSKYNNKDSYTLNSIKLI